MCFKIDDAFSLPHGVTFMKSRMITAKVANTRLEVGLGWKTTRIILARDKTLAEKSHSVATLLRDMISDQRGADAGR